MGFNNVTNTGHLTLAGISCHSPGFQPLDLTMLWLPGGTKNSNINLPRYQGTSPQEVVLDENKVNIPFGFIGDTRWDGEVPEINVYETLEVNIAYFETNIVIPSLGLTGIEAQLVMPSGDNRIGLVQVNGLTLDDRTQDMIKATLTLTIPNGRLGL